MCPASAIASESQIECLRNNGAAEQDGRALSIDSVGSAVVVKGFARNNDTRPIDERPSSSDPTIVPAVARQGSLILCAGQAPWPAVVADRFVYVTGVLTPNEQEVPVHWFEGAQPFVLKDCEVVVGARDEDVLEADREALVAANVVSDPPHIGTIVRVRGRVVPTDRGPELDAGGGLRFSLDCPTGRARRLHTGTLTYTPPLYLAGFPPTDLVKLPGSPFTGVWHLACDPLSK